jgi:hypothetical protein
MNVRYRVTLDTSERVQLVSMVRGGKAAVRKLDIDVVEDPHLALARTQAVKATRVLDERALPRYG